MDLVNEENFDDIINRKTLTVVDFSASWCMPCRMLKPILERVAEKLDHIDFYNLDIDESEDIAKRYRVFSVPTIICFKEGKKVDSMVGLNSYDDVLEFVLRCEKTDVNED
ncbi:MAG TPA: thioredoxin [Candidatus Onthoplasma faecigallinarum]|nr:thioredoxin [Candidatus Onthoplasma faecigallinarum]